MTNRLEDARRKLESETRLTEAVAEARRIESQRAQAAREALAEVAARRAELAARSRSRRRWLPAMAVAVMLAVGAVFYAAMPGSGQTARADGPDWAALEQRVADLKARADSMPGLEIPEESAPESPPAPTPTIADEEPVAEPEASEPEPDPEEEEIDNSPIVLDCDIDSPLGCMDD